MPHLGNIIQALHKPKDWPAIVGNIAELLSFTKEKPHWYMLKESPQCNRGAFEIANSVLTGFRMQSYVARGYPSWLSDLFVNESNVNRISVNPG